MSICPRCKAHFTCAMADRTNQPCWCAALPPVEAALLTSSTPDTEASCFCPHCLPLWKAERLAEKTSSS